VLGACFLGLELYEFAHLIHEGFGPWRSGFLTAFFSLVGTHGLHVTFGIVWLITLMFQVGKHGITPPTTAAWPACRCSGTSWTSSGSACSPLST
jgi:heme/copper-type cytochrome/quinol oxidase subunit 3